MPISNQLPPQNLEAERALLGAMLLSKEACDDVVDLLAKEDFYQNSNGMLFKSMVDFRRENAGLELDLITLVEYLRQKNLLEVCGGVADIASLTSNVPTTTNSRYYAKIIKDYSVRRKMLTLSSQIKDSAYDESTDLTAALDDYQQRFGDISNLTGTKGYADASDLVMQSFDSLSTRRERGTYDGVRSGYSELDQKIGGFKNGEYIIIAARPSVGKTAFALSIAANMAIRQRAGVGFFSLEMSGSSLTDRLLSAESNVNFSQIRSGLMGQTDFEKIFAVANQLYEDKIPLWIQDTPNMKLYDIRSQARKMVRDHDVKAVFIDYIGLIDPDMKGDVPRFEQIGTVSRSLKQLARELNIPVIVLCQVGREGEKQEPGLGNLRDSGSIEQDADLVVILHKERKYEEMSGENAPQEGASEIEKIKIIVAKHRNGEVGFFHMGLKKRTVHFENWEPLPMG